MTFSANRSNLSVCCAVPNYEVRDARRVRPACTCPWVSEITSSNKRILVLVFRIWNMFHEWGKSRDTADDDTFKREFVEIVREGEPTVRVECANVEVDRRPSGTAVNMAWWTPPRRVL